MIKKRVPPQVVISPTAQKSQAAGRAAFDTKLSSAKSKVARPDGQPEKGAGRRKWYITLAIAGTVLLVASAYLAITGTLHDLEQQFFALINHAYLPAWVSEQIAEPVSNAVWGMAFLVAILLIVPKYRLLAWQYVVAAVSSYALTLVIEHIVDRARPVGLEGYNAIMRASQDGPGFPSSHVAVLTALVLTAWPFIAWPWRIVLALFVVAEAWSRIFLGVHAPLDTVGGLAAAAVVVATIHLLPGKIRKVFRLSA